MVKLLKRGDVKEAEAYKNHCLDQAITILDNHPNVRCLFATPKLLEGLCDRVSLKEKGSRVSLRWHGDDIRISSFRC